ncbi:MAG: hypothetical protein V3R51_01460, partial [Gammaproteobacteria bacterium]
MDIPGSIAACTIRPAVEAPTSQAPKITTLVIRGLLRTAVITGVMATPAFGAGLTGSDTTDTSVITMSAFGADLTDSDTTNTDNAPKHDGWLDKSHRFVSGRLNTSVQWFDHFFSDQLSLAEENAAMAIRWRNDFRSSEKDGFEFSSRTHANISLPNISRKLRLIVERDRNGTDSLPEDTVRPADDEVNIGLRYDLRNTQISRLSLSASVNPNFKARYRYIMPISSRTQARILQTGFWRKDDGWGQTSRLDLERQFTPSIFLRWTNSGTYSETSDGVDWFSELIWLNRLSARTAIRFDLGVSGLTDPTFQPTEYIARFRFRRNIHRPWLFYELEPEIAWPVNDGDNRRNDLAFTFRIEIL